MSRGNDRRELFLDSEDYRKYLSILNRCARRFGVTVVAYCLMPNHTHLLLTPYQHPISRLMQQVNSTYCQWFNRKHGRVGHVLQGRYKSQFVEGGPSFLRVLRYMMLNPIRAGLVSQPAQWVWSSFRQAAGISRPSTTLGPTAIWDAIDAANRVHAQRGFRRLVEDDVPSEIESGLIIGSDRFRRGFAAVLEAFRDNRELVHAERFVARPPLDELISGAARGFLLDRAVQLAFHRHAFTLREIGDMVGVSPSTVWTWAHRVAAPPPAVS